ncbi:MAG TPA: POTRA domain-containing protein, partial [Chitinophagaceae bacterium]|nr:POTRA domain-containing protein [Chitinophagaceae bacterium]
MLCVSHLSYAQKNTIETAASSLKTLNPADSLSRIHLRKIFIKGNKKTKDYIILREMELKPGDSIPASSIIDALEKDRRHIFNTTLFLEVTVEPLIVSAFEFDINIIVKERWYIFPLPELQFVDGTFNEWLVKYKGDLNRLNY